MIFNRWLTIALFCTGTAALANETVLLWPNGAPGAVGTEDVDKPALWVYPADKDQANGTGVVICPGGGYGNLAVDHEGTQVARWYNRIGVTAFVLKYRLAPRYQHPAPMHDVQRALQYVRSHAEQYGLSPKRIGIAGFSAGGHLASTAATHFAEAKPESQDPLERVTSRPDFAVLAYPVITMTQNFGHAGSKKNLLGENPSEELAKLMSNELQVTPQTPPTFLFHTGDDTGVPVENALAFYAACRQHKVPAELHVYQFGPHGVGLAPGDAALSTWKDHVHDWLRNSGLLADMARTSVSGSVTLNGEPIKWGQVRLTPQDSPHLPSAFAMIHNGKFRIAADRGPAVGTYVVSVFSQGNIIAQPTVTDSKEVSPPGSLVFQFTEQPGMVDLELKK
ncbi:MAG: alpha/beta hydrolase [Planctomycetaceae bacterium]